MVRELCGAEVLCEAALNNSLWVLDAGSYILMKITKRFLAILFVVSAPLVLLSSAPTLQKAAPNGQYAAYVGTYTTKTSSKGIYSFHFDARTGQFSAIAVAAETPDPSWVAVHPSGKYVYAANEAGKGSTVSAFAVDAKSGRLTLLNQMPSLGEDPCYLSFDKTGKYLLVANYSSGTIAVFPVLPDGRLGEHTALVKDEGATGPNKERQEAPHAHWIETSLDARSAYVADLGLDRVLRYGFDATNGTLSTAPVQSNWSHSALDLSAKLALGSGPRHVAFSRNGAQMYVLGELQSTVTAFQMIGTDDFVPTVFQKISALPKGFSGRNDAAEIALHPSGKFLYTSNRGNDTIAVFNVQRRGGRLSLVANIPTGGKEPRHFAIDPSGNYLLAENQLSNNIVVFKIDLATGLLTPTGQVLDVPSPVDLTFVPTS
jgi:6-phosphogluconolactonase